jgi:hypothetical protein
MHEGGDFPRDGRRACEPHRGPILQSLGAVSMLFGLASVCLFLPSLIGFPLGLWVWGMAREDQEKMLAGRMDPGGSEAAEAARVWANNGLVLCLLSWCVWGLLLCDSWSSLPRLFDSPDGWFDFPDR